ncbi:hypothetical protein SAMN05920897_1591, partial [Alkalispirochaeta americana]
MSLIRLKHHQEALSRDNGRSPGHARGDALAAPHKPCPLCRSLLSRGERLQTRVFSAVTHGSSRTDELEESLVHMFGCLHCRPPGGTCERICPVCKNPVPAEGYVIARMFSRHDRKHLRVLG